MSDHWNPHVTYRGVPVPTTRQVVNGTTIISADLLGAYRRATEQPDRISRDPRLPAQQYSAESLTRSATHEHSQAASSGAKTEQNAEDFVHWLAQDILNKRLRNKQSVNPDSNNLQARLGRAAEQYDVDYATLLSTFDDLARSRAKRAFSDHAIIRRRTT